MCADPAKCVAPDDCTCDGEVVGTWPSAGRCPACRNPPAPLPFDEHMYHGVRNKGLLHCDNCPRCFPERFIRSALTARYHFTVSDEVHERLQAEAA